MGIMVLHARRIVCLSVCLAVIAGGAGAVRGDDLRLGGALETSAGVSSMVSGDASVELVAGLSSVDLGSWTEMSLLPYTMAFETLTLAYVQDWLSLRAEYRFSLAPLGITSATILSGARPGSWETSVGDILVSVSAETEARLAGYSFASLLRTEIWAKVTAGASRRIGCLGPVYVGGSLEATASAPGGGRIWPTPAVVVSATLGHVVLRSETTFSIVGGVRVSAETVSLEGSWSEIGLSGSAWCAFSEGESGPSLGIRVVKEMGDAPLWGFRSGGSCSGGVCR